MRIVGGEARGRPLGRPPTGVRPTSDKVREAVFDILGSVVGLRVLDLFAGTGALGLEALSRGASRVVFVDESPRCARAIRENAARLGLESRVLIVRAPVRRALPSLSERFDLVFADPPYGRGLGEEALAVLARSDVFLDNALVVLETATRDATPEAEGLVRLQSRKYGDTTVHLYRPSSVGAEALVR